MRSIDLKFLICLAPRGYYIRGYSSSVITAEAPHTRSSNVFITPEAPHLRLSHLLITPEALTPGAPHLLITPEALTPGAPHLRPPHQRLSPKHSSRTRERCVFGWKHGNFGRRDCGKGK